ncbi:MAG: SDR family oxidoreductase [Candidatus Cyclobacteriaceae bacterium M2_1C_046]
MPKSTAAVISGASSGIGKSILEKIKDQFTTCYNLDVSAPEKNPKNFIKTDVSEIEEVDKAVQKFSQSGEKLKCIISNAGIGVHEKLTEGDPVKWKKVINTNVVGSLNLIRAFIPLMDEGGDIIFISSVAAGNPYEFGGVYAASKAAINTIAETLRIETKPDIRVTVIEPGLIRSDFLGNTISGERSFEEVPFKAIDPVHVANAVKYTIDQPRDVSINNITIRPSDQNF